MINGQKVRELRGVRTQREICHAANVDQCWLSRIEHNSDLTREFKLLTIWRLARALHTTIDTLLLLPTVHAD